jgi:hypothetical protein
VQNWSTAATYAWMPSTAASYTVSVWVRSAGVTADSPQASAQVAYTVAVTPGNGSGSTQTFVLRIVP